MTMSTDRVRFILPNRYFQVGKLKRQNGFNRCTMQNVLYKAFGLTLEESGGLMDHYPHGFEIECRPSQFARFIILRYQMNEGINGIRDLEPKIVQPSKSVDVYQRVADKLDLAPYGGADLVRAIKYMFDEMTSSHTPVYPKYIDVSQRPA